MSSDAATPSRWDENITRWTGAGALLWVTVVRLLSSPSRAPWWELDPLLGWRPETTLTPAMSISLDALVWMAAALIISADLRAGRTVHWKSGLLALLGAGAVALHGVVLRPPAAMGGGPRGDFDSLILGSSWAGAVVGAWALMHAARAPELRRAAGAIVISVIIILCAKGAYQALVEHPRITAAYDADPQSMLAAKGWELGSAQARLFERRLRQVEATGWFGLANVYGSVAAGCCVAWIALAIAAVKQAKDRRIGSGEAGATVLIAIAAAAALGMSGSKGAVGAACVGLASLVIAMVLRRPRLRPVAVRAGIAVALAVPLLVIAGVVFRGAFGDQLPERSLLFRAQYLEGASRIIAEHPAVGVGPLGFKEAYLLAKPPTSPEEVESPHSLFFDLLARLGALGLAWCALWMFWLARAGAGLAQEQTPPELKRGRGVLWWSGALLSAGVAGGLWIEAEALHADGIALLAIAGVVAITAVACVFRLSAAAGDASLRMALASAAIALAAHAMIEVTPVVSGSAAWFFALFAIAAAPAPQATPNRASRTVGIGLLCALVLAASALGWRAIGAWRWEASLQAAATALRPVGELHDALAEASASGSSSRERLQRTLASTARQFGLPPPASAEDVHRLFRAVRAQTIPRAISHLDMAATLEPTAWEPRSAAARLELALAFDLSDQGNDAEAGRRIESARRRVAAHVAALPASAAAWGKLANFCGAVAALQEARPTPSLDAVEPLEAAVVAWEAVARLDPYGLQPRRELWRLNLRLGRHQAAAEWARESLAIDELFHLDPLKGLTDTERERLREDASAAGEPGRKRPGE